LFCAITPEAPTHAILVPYGAIPPVLAAVHEQSPAVYCEYVQSVFARLFLSVSSLFAAEEPSSKSLLRIGIVAP
jgi:hypothetical protein